MGFDIRIADTVNDSITDGPGIRFVIFTQGCPFLCEGCHNPQTHDYAGGRIIDTDVLFEMIRRNPLLTGVTFSGGEPFIQAEPLSVLAGKIKSAGLELAVYTGYRYEEIIEENDPYKIKLLDLTDTIIDGRFVSGEKSMTLKFKGSANQRIIDVRQSRLSGRVIPDTSDRWN